MTLFDENNSAPSEPETQVESQEPSWWWDANTPGQGERPEFLSPKYKTVSDMAKAQRELEKRLGSAPDKYDLSKGQSWVEEEHESIKKMTEYAKSKHVPQDVVDVFMESVSDYFSQFNVDPETEKKKLGDSANERIEKLQNWAKSNLSEKAYGAITSSMRTAEAVEALEELRNKMLSTASQIPSGKETAQSGEEGLAQWRSELNANYAKYKSDPSYRKSMDSKLANIMGETS